MSKVATIKFKVSLYYRVKLKANLINLAKPCLKIKSEDRYGEMAVS